MHVEHDCATGETKYTPLTESELLDAKQLASTESTKQLTEDTKRAQRAALIKDAAAKDPAFRALAEELGIDFV